LNKLHLNGVCLDSMATLKELFAKKDLDLLTSGDLELGTMPFKT